MNVDITQGLINAALYLGIPMILLMMWGMYSWERTCRKKIRVLLVKQSGGSENVYVPKEGGEVTITNTALGVTRTWPINQLATIPTAYPELGILPRFMQREIQTAILHEGDWEPVLNRSPHRDNVISPNVVKILMDAQELLQEKGNNPELVNAIDNVLNNAVTGPTREMVADPAVLGALKVSTAMKALASVSDDLLEALKGIRNQLSRFSGLNSTYIYIGLGLVIVMQGVALYYVVQGGLNTNTDLINKIDAIYRALGIQ